MFRNNKLICLILLLLVSIGFDSKVDAQSAAPIKYNVKIQPEEKAVTVEATIPVDGEESIILMMPVWTPGFYKIMDYANQVSNFSAKSSAGKPLSFERTRNNRWQIKTKDEKAAVVSYQIDCGGGRGIGNTVNETYASINGAATFVSLLGDLSRPHEVQLVLPEGWSKSATGLSRLGEGTHRYRAKDFDVLVDSPIVAGKLSIVEFEVDGSKHYWVDVGDYGNWDAKAATKKIKKIVEENRAFWGELPFKEYFFLNVFKKGRGGGGLEHMNSTLLTASQQVSRRWLSFICHEYFHSFNVKRLRPIQLGPFDYEVGPRTDGLWISEGLTNYYGDLLVARAGLSNTEEYLASMSKFIDQLQKSPGRLQQSLADASLDVFTSSGMSGFGGDRNKTISYYTKGPIAGFLLDAKIRRATDGKKSLDDVMRLAYSKYSGERGFKSAEFVACAEQVSGTNLKAWFQSAINSTDELEYDEALDWYGLKFGKSEDGQKAWTLEVKANATAAQNERLESLISGKPTTGDK